MARDNDRRRIGSGAMDGQQVRLDDRQWAQSVKRALRQKLRSVREALPETAMQVRSARIVRYLLDHPRVRAARAVASYWPMLERREVDLRALDLQLRLDGKSVYYPFMTPLEQGGFETGFRLTSTSEDLVVGHLGFAQPPRSAHVATRGDIDVVIVPALAAAPDGNRLGYGAGFYDATLGDVCPPAFSIVAVYDFQLLVELPLESGDFKCDEVATDGRQRASDDI